MAATPLVSHNPSAEPTIRNSDSVVDHVQDPPQAPAARTHVSWGRGRSPVRIQPVATADGSPCRLTARQKGKGSSRSRRSSSSGHRRDVTPDEPSPSGEPSGVRHRASYRRNHHCDDTPDHPSPLGEPSGDRHRADYRGILRSDVPLDPSSPLGGFSGGCARLDGHCDRPRYPSGSGRSPSRDRHRSRDRGRLRPSATVVFEERKSRNPRNPDFAPATVSLRGTKRRHSPSRSSRSRSGSCRDPGSSPSRGRSRSAHERSRRRNSYSPQRRSRHCRRPRCRHHRSSSYSSDSDEEYISKKDRIWVAADPYADEPEVPVITATSFVLDWVKLNLNSFWKEKVPLWHFSPIIVENLTESERAKPTSTSLDSRIGVADRLCIGKYMPLFVAQELILPGQTEPCAISRGIAKMIGQMFKDNEAKDDFFPLWQSYFRYECAMIDRWFSLRRRKVRIDNWSSTTWDVVREQDRTASLRPQAHLSPHRVSLQRRRSVPRPHPTLPLPHLHRTGRGDRPDRRHPKLASVGRVARPAPTPSGSTQSRYPTTSGMDLMVRHTTALIRPSPVSTGMSGAVHTHQQNGAGMNV